MTNLGQRLLLFAVCVPAIVLGIFFLPQFNHALLVAPVVVFFLGGGALELARLFKAEGLKVRTGLVVGIAVAPPLLFYASSFFPGVGSDFILVGLACISVLVFLPFAFARQENFADTLPAASAYAFVLLYLGVLGGFAVLNVSSLGKHPEAILAFAFMVIGTDSLAWLCGITIGRHKGIFAVSPNKSLEGFIGGFAGSVAGAFIVKAIFPSSFSIPAWQLVLMALCVAGAAILGDLFESALKRSAGTKDSGTKVPGRGGFLDSFDSFLFAAPVFYLASRLLGLFL